MSHKSKSKLASLRSSRAYVSVVTALTTFLVGLAVWRLPVQEYVSTASLLDRRRISEPAVDPVAEIKSSENLRRAVRLLGLFEASGNSSGAVTEEEFIHSIQGQLEGVVETTSKPDERLIVISYRDQDALQTLSLVDYLVHQYVLDHTFATDSESAREKHRAAKEDLERSAEVMHRAESDLSNFLAEQIERYTERQERRHASVSMHRDKAQISPTATEMSLPIAPTSQPTSVPQVPANPTLDLQLTELNRLKERRRKILRDFTETHPSVQELNDQIRVVSTMVPDDSQTQTDPNISDAEKNRQPEQATAGTSNTDPSPSKTLANSRGANQAVQSFADFDWVDVRARFYEVKNNYEFARLDHVTAIQTERNAWGKIHSTICSAVSVIHEASITQRVKGPNGSRIFWLGSAALIIGIAFGRTSPKRDKDPLVAEVDQARQLLPAPVIGIIASPAKPIGVTVRRLDKLVRLTVTSSELLLALFGLAFLASAFLDNGFATNFVDDPIGTVSGALQSSPHRRL